MSARCSNQCVAGAGRKCNHVKSSLVSGLSLGRADCPGNAPRSALTTRFRLLMPAGDSRGHIQGGRASGQIFPFPLSPVCRGISCRFGRRFFWAPCFPPQNSLPMALGSPGPTEPGHWPFAHKKQFRRTIIGPLLIPAHATPGGLNRFWTARAWQSGRTRGRRHATLGFQSQRWPGTG